MACRRSSVRPRYAPPDLTEKAKRIRASPFLLNLPRRSSGAALARHPTERSRAIAPAVFPRPSNLAKRIRASPFLLNLPRRSSGAAPARHPTERSRATTPRSPRPSNLAKRIRASPFLFNLPRRSSGAAPARHPKERSRATTPPSPRPSKRASEHQRRAFALSDFATGLAAIEIGEIRVRLRQGNGGCSSSRPFCVYDAPFGGFFSNLWSESPHRLPRSAETRDLSSAPSRFYCARAKERTRSLLKRVVIKRRFP